MRWTQFILILVLVACGKARELRLDEQARSASKFSFVEPLAGRPVEDVLRLKYLEEPRVVCDLRVADGFVPGWDERGEEVLFSGGPQKSVSARVQELEARPLAMSLRKRGTRVTYAISLRTPLVFAPEKNENKRGKRYLREFSPFLTIDVDELVTYRAQGQEKSQINILTMELTENVEQRVSIRTVYGEDTTTQELRCVLRTRIRPEYQFQWVEEDLPLLPEIPSEESDDPEDDGALELDGAEEIDVADDSQPEEEV